MSKTKKNGTTHYELLYILSNQFTLEEAKKIDEQIRKIIFDQGGKVTYNNEWGKKKLAYPIVHNTHGYYYLVEFDILGEYLSKIDEWLKMNRDILRHQIVKTKKRIQEEKEKEKGKRAQVKHKKEIEEEKTQTSEKRGEEKTQISEKRGEEDKTDLKDLDKKLDDILDSHDLL